MATKLIEHAAAVRCRIERPAERVLHQAGLHPSFGKLPELLEPECIGLRIAGRIELEPAHQLLGETAATSLGKYGNIGPNFGAGSEIRPRGAVSVEAHVADLHADDRTGLIAQRVCGRKSCEDVDPKRL